MASTTAAGANPGGIAAVLATLGHPRAELSFAPLGTSAREARYRLMDPSGQPITVLYSTLPPVDGPLDAGRFTHELNLSPDTRWHALPQTFGAGERLAWTVSERVPALGCSVWTGVRREVLW